MDHRSSAQEETSAPARAGKRIGKAILAAGRMPRGALARLRRSPLMLWRHRPQAAEELLIAPPDLRTQDPSLADEIAYDSFGLAGSVVTLGGRSPFQVPPPNADWERELHSFGWLRHLDAGRTAEVEGVARNLVREWIAATRRRQSPSWAHDIAARRVIAWLSHAALLLDGAEKRPYTAILRSLDEQITFLSATWRDAPDGYPRLLSLMALVNADLCIAGRDRQLAHSVPLLVAELDRQILPDGGHASRNPALLVELMLDLLPLRQCFGARGIAVPAALTSAIARMAPMLRTLVLGDGLLARFNGVGFTERDTLATALAYDESPPLKPAAAPPSGYLRLERGATVMVMDAGASPPELEMAGSACAGCLSFEMSAGADLLLVNAGRPAGPDLHARAVSRATASHNTLCVNEQSSATLVRNARIEQEIGAVPIRQPDIVPSEVHEDDSGIMVQASHDGYAVRFKLVHARKLHLDAAGIVLSGTDTLAGTKGVLRLAWDLPFAIHFHLHPDVEANFGQTPDVVDLSLDTGEHWRFSASGAVVSIEDSSYFADIGDAQPAQQVVLRGVCCGASEVNWRLERVRQGRPLDAKTRQRLRSERRQAR